MHVAEGADFGWRLMHGARCCRPDFARGAVAGELPGKCRRCSRPAAARPPGCSSTTTPAARTVPRPALLPGRVPQAGPGVQDRAGRSRRSRSRNEFEFLKSDDPLFRPCQMVTGPDGAIYVVRLAHRLRRRRQALRRRHPRPHLPHHAGPAPKTARRSRCRGMDSWAKILKLPDDKLVETLGRPGPDRPRRGPQGTGPPRAEGARPRADEVRLRQVRRRRPARRASACCRRTGTPDVEDLFRLLLNDDSADVRRLAVDALGLNAKPKDADARGAARGARRPTPGRAPGRGAGARPARRRRGRRARSSTPGRPTTARDVFLKDAYVRGDRTARQAGHRRAARRSPTSGDKRTSTGRRQRSSRSAPKPAADAMPELLGEPARQRRPSARRWSGRTRTTSSTRRSRSTRSPTYLAAHPDEPAACSRAAVEVFAASRTGSTSPKATSYVLGLLDSRRTPRRPARGDPGDRGRPADGAPRRSCSHCSPTPTRPAGERAAVVKALRVLNDKAGRRPSRRRAARRAGPGGAEGRSRCARSPRSTPCRPHGRREAARPAGPGPARPRRSPCSARTKPGAKLIGERFVAEEAAARPLPAGHRGAQEVHADDPAIAKLHGRRAQGRAAALARPGADREDPQAR